MRLFQFFYKEKKITVNRWEEVAAKGIPAKLYWTYWDALVVRNGILHKMWEAPNLKSNFLQLIVLQRSVKRILEEA